MDTEKLAKIDSLNLLLYKDLVFIKKKKKNEKKRNPSIPSLLEGKILFNKNNSNTCPPKLSTIQLRSRSKWITIP